MWHRVSFLQLMKIEKVVNPERHKSIYRQNLHFSIRVKQGHNTARSNCQNLTISYAQRYLKATTNYNYRTAVPHPRILHLFIPNHFTNRTIIQTNKRQSNRFWMTLSNSPFFFLINKIIYLMICQSWVHEHHQIIIFSIKKGSPHIKY